MHFAVSYSKSAEEKASVMMQSEMQQLIGRSEIGRCMIPTKKLIHPEEEVESRELNEEYCLKFAKQLLREKKLVKPMECEVLLRVDAKWWETEGESFDEKPKTVNEVKESFERSRAFFAKQNWKYEVISGAHRRRTLELCNNSDEGNPDWTRMNCVVYVETRAGKAPLWQDYGSLRNEIDHEHRANNPWDLIKKWTKRWENNKKQNTKMSSFMNENIAAFKKDGHSLHMGNLTIFRLILNISKWSTKSKQILRDYYTKKTQTFNTLGKDMSWCSTPSLRYMSETDYVFALEKIMHSKKYTLKHAKADLHRKQCICQCKPLSALYRYNALCT